MKNTGIGKRACLATWSVLSVLEVSCNLKETRMRCGLLLVNI